MSRETPGRENLRLCLWRQATKFLKPNFKGFRDQE
jgi:hypothetical protein